MLIAATMIISVAEPLKATSIDDEKKKQEELENELNDVQGTLDELEKLKGDMDAYITTMDAKLTEISKHIAELDEQAAKKQVEIDEINVTLNAKEEDIASQYDSMKLRIRFMYENGQTQYLDMILSSDGIGDFLNKAEYIAELTQYDRNMLDRMKETKQQIENTKSTLETEQQELSNLISEAETEQASVETLMEAKKEQIEAAKSQISIAEQQIVDKQNEIDVQEEYVSVLEAEQMRKEEEERIRKQQEEAAANSNNNLNSDSGNSTVITGGSFVWPVPEYYYISSPFGYRDNPTNTGNVQYHKGIDISTNHSINQAGISGKTIVAAASGKVVWATKSLSAGNWVIIDHGSGLYTVYMHMSYYDVEKGQSVSAGQKIGAVGSTGDSTGPHLHFGVWVGTISTNSGLSFESGGYVDPSSYLGI